MPLLGVEGGFVSPYDWETPEDRQRRLEEEARKRREANLETFRQKAAAVAATDITHKLNAENEVQRFRSLAASLSQAQQAAATADGVAAANTQQEVDRFRRFAGAVMGARETQQFRRTASQFVRQDMEDAGYLPPFVFPGEAPGVFYSIPGRLGPGWEPPGLADALLKANVERLRLANPGLADLTVDDLPEYQKRRLAYATEDELRMAADAGNLGAIPDWEMGSPSGDVILNTLKWAGQMAMEKATTPLLPRGAIEKIAEGAGWLAGKVGGGDVQEAVRGETERQLSGLTSPLGIGLTAASLGWGAAGAGLGRAAALEAAGLGGSAALGTAGGLLEQKGLRAQVPYLGLGLRAGGELLGGPIAANLATTLLRPPRYNMAETDGLAFARGEGAPEIREIPVDKIDLDLENFQARDVPKGMPVDPKAVRELADNWSIDRYSPILVAEQPGGRYVLLSGHHRLEAWKLMERTAAGEPRPIQARVLTGLDLGTAEGLARAQGLAASENLAVMPMNLAGTLNTYVNVAKEAGVLPPSEPLGPATWSKLGQAGPDDIAAISKRVRVRQSVVQRAIDIGVLGEAVVRSVDNSNAWADVAEVIGSRVRQGKLSLEEGHALFNLLAVPDESGRVVSRAGAERTIDDLIQAKGELAARAGTLPGFDSLPTVLDAVRETALARQELAAQMRRWNDLNRRLEWMKEKAPEMEAQIAPLQEKALARAAELQEQLDWSATRLLGELKRKAGVDLSAAEEAALAGGAPPPPPPPPDAVRTEAGTEVPAPEGVPDPVALQEAADGPPVSGEARPGEWDDLIERLKVKTVETPGTARTPRAPALEPGPPDYAVLNQPAPVDRAPTVSLAAFVPEEVKAGGWARLWHGRGGQDADAVMFWRTVGLRARYVRDANLALLQNEVASTLWRYLSRPGQRLPIETDARGLVRNFASPPPEGMSRVWTDVVENIDRYVPYLSPRQVAFANELLTVTKRIGRSLEDWGLLRLPDVKDATELDVAVRNSPDVPAGVVAMEPGGYMPRVRKDTARGRVRARPFTPRKMEEAAPVVEKGGAWYGIEESLDAYVNAIVEKMMMADIRAFADGQGVRLHIAEESPSLIKARQEVDALERAKDLVQRAIRGERVPAQSVVAVFSKVRELSDLIPDIPGKSPKRLFQQTLDEVIEGGKRAEAERRFSVPLPRPGEIAALARERARLRAALAEAEQTGDMARASQLATELKRVSQRWGFKQHLVASYLEEHGWPERGEPWPQLLVELAPNRFLLPPGRREALGLLLDYLLGPTDEAGRRTGGLLAVKRQELAELQKARSAEVAQARVRPAWRGMVLTEPAREGLRLVLADYGAGGGSAVLDATIGAYRTMKLGLDLGLAGTYGPLMSATDIWAIPKVVVRSGRVVFSPESAAEFRIRHARTIAEMARYGLSARTEIVPSALGGMRLGHVPVVGSLVRQTYGRAARGFTEPILQQLALTWEALRDTPAWRGRPKELAEFLRSSFGLWDPNLAGVSPGLMRFASLFGALAPRLTASALDNVRMVLRYGPTDPRGRWAFKGILKTIGAMYALYTIAAVATNQDTKRFVRGLDPRSGGDYLTIDVGEWRIGLGGIVRALLTLTANMGDALAPGGRPASVLGEAKGPLVGFWTGRAAPAVTWGGKALESLSGHDFAPYEEVPPPKQPLALGANVAEGVLPFTATAALGGEPAASLPLTFLGFNVTRPWRTTPEGVLAQLPRVEPELMAAAVGGEWTKEREATAHAYAEEVNGWLNKMQSPQLNAAPFDKVMWYYAQIHNKPEQLVKDAVYWRRAVTAGTKGEWGAINPEWLGTLLRYESDPHVRERYAHDIASEWYAKVKEALRTGQGLDAFPQGWLARVRQAAGY